MIGSDSLFGINPHLYAKMPVDPQTEFVPVATLTANQLVLAVNPTIVTADDLRVGEIAAEYLIQCGHRRLALINPKPDHVTFRRRELGFIGRAQAAGLAVQRFVEATAGLWSLPLHAAPLIAVLLVASAAQAQEASPSPPPEPPPAEAAPAAPAEAEPPEPPPAPPPAPEKKPAPAPPKKKPRPWPGLRSRFDELTDGPVKLNASLFYPIALLPDSDLHGVLGPLEDGGEPDRGGPGAAEADAHANERHATVREDHRDTVVRGSVDLPPAPVEVRPVDHRREAEARSQLREDLHRAAQEGDLHVSRVHHHQPGRSRLPDDVEQHGPSPLPPLSYETWSRELVPGPGPPHFAASKRCWTASQLTTFHQAPRYSGRRFWYLR